MKVFTIVFLGIVAVSTVRGHSKDKSPENPLAFLQSELDPLVSFVLKNYFSDWNFVVFKGKIPRKDVSVKEYLKKLYKKHNPTIGDALGESLELIDIDINETPAKKYNAVLKGLPINVKELEEALEDAFPKGTKKVAYNELVVAKEEFLIKVQSAFITEKLLKLLF